MNNYTFILSIFILGIASFGLYSIPENDINDPILSVYESALLSKNQLNSDSLSSTLLASEIIEKNIEETKSNNQLEIIHEKLNLPQEQLALILKDLNLEHEAQLAKMNEQNLNIDYFYKIKPSLKLVLAFYLDESIDNLKVRNIESLSLSQQDWYLLKAFSESDELIELLDRGEMSSEYLEISYLADSYQESELSYQDSQSSEF